MCALESHISMTFSVQYPDPGDIAIDNLRFDDGHWYDRIFGNIFVNVCARVVRVSNGIESTA